jgi:hypothetical protein
MNSPALLVVHGIGTQKRGDVLRQCVLGLLAVCQEACLLDAGAKLIVPDDIRTNNLDHVRIRQGSHEIRLYEVYWADLLPDEAVQGNFSKFDFEETTWFPLLNWRAGLLPREDYSMPLIAARTFELWLLQVVVTFALEIVIASRKIRSTVLDETAADVWNYVHSLAGDLAADSPLVGSGERILDRFQSAWERARAEGHPNSGIHVIAHSLGSVIAYHGMAQRLPEHSIQRLITVGSPLEKVRFLWAKLFTANFQWTCEWLNCYTTSDPVSGKLKRFDLNPQRRIQNFRLWGVGGFGEAHVGYFRDPRVMRIVAAGLGVCANATSKSVGPSWLLRRLTDIAVPIGTAVLMLLGVLVTGLFFYAVIWLTSAVVELPLRLFSPTVAAQVGHAWRSFWSWIMLPLSLVFLTKDGYNRAASRHKRCWR